MLIKFHVEDTALGPSVAIGNVQISRGCAGAAECLAVIAEIEVDLKRVTKLLQKRAAAYPTKALL